MHDIFVVPVHAGAQLSAQWRTFAFIQFVASAVARVEFSIPRTFQVTWPGFWVPTRALP